MPTSQLLIWPSVLNLVETATPHRTVLDVGPGHGKAATLLREYLNEPPEVIAAVEAWEPYVDDHRLERLYDGVLRADVRECTAEVLSGYDVILMVDVIEHLPLLDAFDVLERCAGRIVICTPVAWFSNGPGLPPTEEHVSHWTLEHWTALGERRPLEVCYQEHGGWLVRLGPLP